MKKFLLCPPNFYDIEYSINPWMDKKNKVGQNKSKQWNALLETFKTLKIKTELIQPIKGLPDMVFVDAGIKYKKYFIPSNFKYLERQGERKWFKKWFKNYGLKIIDIPKQYYFEGHGDSLWAGKKKLFLGWGFRSSVEAHQKIRDFFFEKDNKIKIFSIHIIDERFYHLDTCFCPLNDKEAIIYKDAISPESLSLLKENMKLIYVEEDEAKMFACNSVILGKNIIMPFGAKKIQAKLKRKGYKIYEVKMSEFIKAGGACKCLSFEL